MNEKILIELRLGFCKSYLRINNFYLFSQFLNIFCNIFNLVIMFEFFYYYYIVIIFSVYLNIMFNDIS